MISPGTYRARALSWSTGESKNGTPRLAIKFEIIGQPGETITYYGYLSDKAKKYTHKTLRTCGWDGQGDETDIAELPNEVSLVVEDEDYNGKTYTKVKWVNAIKGGAPTEAAKAIGKLAKGGDDDIPF